MIIEERIEKKQLNNKLEQLTEKSKNLDKEMSDVKENLNKK